MKGLVADMKDIFAIVLLFTYVVIIPTGILILMHFLSVRFKRNLTWIAPVAVIVIASAMLMFEVIPNGKTLPEAWKFYIHSDAAIGLALLYVPAVSFSVVLTVGYYVTQFIKKRKIKNC
ncbi:MAG TPA: hypothetical protein VIK09_05770 [Candidatus Humimicrobiaceae bacterium]